MTNKYESATIIPPYVYINERVPRYDSDMPEYGKDEIKKYLLKTGCDKEFVEGIDNNFCQAFDVTARAISRDLKMVYNK